MVAEMERHGFGDLSSWSGEAFYWIWQPESQGEWRWFIGSGCIIITWSFSPVVDSFVRGLEPPPLKAVI